MSARSHAFWEANMELVSVVTAAQFVRPEVACFYTPGSVAPGQVCISMMPDRRGEAIQSMVSGGCLSSPVRKCHRSLMFSRVRSGSHTASIDRLRVVLPDVELSDARVSHHSRHYRSRARKSHRMNMVIGEDHRCRSRTRLPRDRGVG